MEISPIPNYLVYSIKRLPTPKVNNLQSPKLRHTQSLLVATFTQTFMRFRCTVMEKCHQNFPPHSSMCDDRYHAHTHTQTHTHTHPPPNTHTHSHPPPPPPPHTHLEPVKTQVSLVAMLLMACLCATTSPMFEHESGFQSLSRPPLQPLTSSGRRGELRVAREEMVLPCE